MKKTTIILIASALTALDCIEMCAKPQTAKTSTTTATTVKKTAVREIGEKEFSTLIADFNSKDWKFLGKRPAIVDFSATWCGPCRQLSPILDQLATSYSGKIDFYKVDVDKCPNLSRSYGVSSVPMLIFCPTTGNPTAVTGLYPKEELVKAIEYVFKIK